MAQAATGNDYTDRCTLVDVDAQSVKYKVANESVFAQLMPRNPHGGASPWGPEFSVTPEDNAYQDAIGIRFRSRVAGAPAQVQAQSFGEGDPSGGGGIPVLGTLSSTGAFTPAAAVLDVARLSLATPPQSIPNGVASPLALAAAYDWNSNSAIFAPRGGIVTGFFVAAGGLFEVIAYVVYAASAVGTRYTPLRVNGVATDLVADVRGASPTLVTEVIVTDVLQLAANDFVELYAFQSSGGALDVVAAHINLARLQ